mmetsp:Transcript_24473/g.51954  ORF Transcript_24473/g.51954 Transcript_24473/m.51954 type:complete len:291 (-) Transcript_24473:272-1144(-)
MKSFQNAKKKSASGKMGQLHSLCRRHCKLAYFHTHERAASQVRLALLHDVLGREALPSEAHVDEALLRGNELTLLLLAKSFGRLKLRRGAVADVRPVRNDDGSLRARQDQISGSHTLCAQALPNLHPVIIGRITVGRAALPVLIGLTGHGELNVHVVALARFVPAVDLKRDAERQGDVQNVERLAIPTLLQDLPLGVVLDIDKRVCRVEARREACQDILGSGTCEPHRGRLGVEEELVTLQERAANGNLLGHSEAVGDWRRLVAGLDPDGVALHEPILTRRVVVCMGFVK